VKKILALTLTVLLVLAVLAPTAALAETTSVNVALGGGELPIVKCKWEQQPVDVCPNLEDGDPTHAEAGFQILPPLEAGATKTICYYTVVTDEEDGGNVSQAFADVYHPMYSPMPYGAEVTGGILGLGYFKYEIPFAMYDGDKWEMMAVVQTAYDAGLITFNTEYDLTEVLYELEKGTAKLWVGCAEIDYEQPAGDYDVYVFAVDQNSNFSAPLYNQFLYVPVCGIEVDFTSIAWGSTSLGVEKMIPGDTIWDDPAGVNNATVRNIGNTWTHVTVEFDDMGFGQNILDEWNVQFDARMGSDDAYYVGNIMPYDLIVLPNALGLSMKDELDFSIKIIKGAGEHQGVITLGCDNTDVYPFVDPVPPNIVGFDATVDY